jgi:hypothetical protein
MRITSRILGLVIPLLLIGCTKWGPDKKASRAVDLYSDVQQIGTEDTIPSGTICRIDQRLSMGKIYGFHKIECQNGQVGYLMLGDDEEAFEANYQAKASSSVDLYSDLEGTAMPDAIPSGTICRIDRRLSMGKVFTFHRIECQNGQSGYLPEGDERAFEPTHTRNILQGHI